jgi:hypothetical protein
MRYMYITNLWRQTPRGRILLEKLVVAQLVNKLTAFNEDLTRRFITVFTKPSVDRTLNHMNPFQTPSSYFFRIQFSSFRLNA